MPKFREALRSFGVLTLGATLALTGCKNKDEVMDEQVTAEANEVREEAIETLRVEEPTPKMEKRVKQEESLSKTSPKYLAYTRELGKCGVDVDAEFIAALSAKKGNSDLYMGELLRMCAEGYFASFIDADFVRALTFKKGTSRKYVDALLQFYNGNVSFVDDEFVAALTFKMGTDPELVAYLLGVAEETGDVDADFLRNL